jgi:hypothetical protein
MHSFNGPLGGLQWWSESVTKIRSCNNPVHSGKATDAGAKEDLNRNYRVS